jgi:hypothetical protein
MTNSVSTAATSGARCLRRGRPDGDLGWTRALSLPGLAAIELLLIALVAAIVGRDYLNFDPWVVPTGRDFAAHVQSHHLWTRVLQCGWCAMWDGSTRGGYPGLVDPLASMLHPVVMVTTLGWGVVNGSKLALVVAFLIGGLTQWWLARELGLGWPARLWSAGLGVTASHVAAKMEGGLFALAMSTATCTLAWPALLALGRRPTRRAAVVLGMTLALAAVSGQGYPQMGVAAGLPAAFLLVPWGRERIGLLIRRLALAVGLAALLAAPFLVPLLHFLPEFAKDRDPVFTAAQPFAYVPLHLVIDDHAFYRTDKIMSKIAFPWMYANFVGWVPVLLAVWALRGARSTAERRAVAFLALLVVLMFWLASATLFAWIVRVSPFPSLSEPLTAIRSAPLIASLATPAVLALAAIGLDRLLKLPWPRLTVSVSAGAMGRALSLDPRWLLVVPLVLSVAHAHAFNKGWITVTRVGAEVPAILERLRTPDLQWITPPPGDLYFIQPAIAFNLKQTVGFQPWHWKDRPFPMPVLEAARQDQHAEGTVVGTVAGTRIFRAPPGREYAFIAHPDGARTLCSANGQGGDIDVACIAPRPGTLTVLENSWSGWHARIDDVSAPLRSGRWLAIDVPEGAFRAEFRYRPWDVPLGLALGCLGGIIAALIWVRSDSASRPELDAFRQPRL